MERLRLLKFTLRFIALVQIVLGIAFLLAPMRSAALLGLSAAPMWTAWLFGMMAARFLGFGYGMIVAARDPVQHRAWIGAMVFIQAIDWLVTLYYLSTGAVTLAQVTTAAFLPAVFILLVVSVYPRANAPAVAG